MKGESLLHKRSYTSIVNGMGYFITKPNLWQRSLPVSVFTWIILFTVFVTVVYQIFPNMTGGFHWRAQIFDIFHAFAVGGTVVFCIWAFVFPCLLQLIMEKSIIQVHQDRKQRYFISSRQKLVLSAGKMVLLTSHWRALWLIACVITLFFSPITCFIISQVGIGHTAILDASNLTLGVCRINFSDRVYLFKKHWVALLTAGLVAGLFSAILLPTIMGWAFWLSSAYIGMSLFWNKRLETISEAGMKETELKSLNRDFYSLSRH
jgi:hypothetical protein